MTKKRPYRFSSRVVPELAVAIDLVCLGAAAIVALSAHSFFIGGSHEPQIHVAAVTMAGIAFLLIRISRDAYSRPLSRIEDADHGVLMDYALGALLAIAMVWQFGLATYLSRGLVLFYIGSALVFLFFSRWWLRVLVRHLAKSGHIAQRVALLASDGCVASRAAELLELERLPHVELVGVADDGGGRGSPVKGLSYLGGLADIVALAQQGELDQVLIAIEDIDQDRLDKIVYELSRVSLDISLVPREALALNGNYKVNFIGSFPVLSISHRPVRDIDNVAKAIEDRAVAALALVLLSPLLLLTVALIKLTSPGPVLFRQRRFGFNNTEIMVLKFRTMYVDRQDVSGSNRTTKNDGRVTPLGRVLRRLSIDELPQLLNVLRGEMSIVGPRPHATHMKVGDRFYFDAVKGYAARHRVKPGITGLAQVRGLRGEIATIERAKKRVEYDCFYIENWSILLDLRVIAETMAKLAFDRNAY